MVERQLRAGRLAVVLPALATQGLPLHIVWQRSRQHAPKVRTLIAHFEGAQRIGPETEAQGS